MVLRAAVWFAVGCVWVGLIVCVGWFCFVVGLYCQTLLFLLGFVILWFAVFVFLGLMWLLGLVWFV